MSAAAASAVAAPAPRLLSRRAETTLAKTALVALWPMASLLALQIVASIGLCLGVPLGAWTLPTALALGAIAFRLAEDQPSGVSMRMALYGGLLMIGSVLLAGSIYDWSWDGQHYHQELVIQLAQGWNPATTPFVEAERGIVDREMPMWMNHYPRALGVFAAAVYLVTGQIETGKFFNPLLIALAGIYVYGGLRSLGGLSPLWSALLALCLSVNNIAAAQMLSFYNDGAIYSAMILIGVAGAHYLARPGPVPAIILLSAVALAANAKFTGLVFAVAVLGGLGLAALHRAEARSLAGRIKAVLPVAGLFAAALVLPLLLIGVSTYLPNFFYNGHPFHPLMGAHAFDIVTRSTPEVFKPLSGPEALFASIFGSPEIGTQRYAMRYPFIPIDLTELNSLSTFDPRVGGWGPTFPEQLIIGAGVVAALLIRARDRRAALFGAFGFGMVLFLGLIHPEAWWARYSAFLLAAPWFAFAAAAIAGWEPGQGRFRILAGIGVALMLLNNLPVAVLANLRNYEISARITRQLDHLASLPKPVHVSLGLFHSTRVKLADQGIEAEIVARSRNLPCEISKPLFNGHYISQYCGLGWDRPEEHSKVWIWRKDEK